MLELPSVQSCPETPFTFRSGQRAVRAQHTPRQNRILAALHLEDLDRLLRDLEPVSLPLGTALYGAGDLEKYLYFLCAGLVSRFQVMHSGVATEFALTGCEGVIGVATFLGGESAPSQAAVVSAGYAYRLPASSVRKEFELGSPLAYLLLRYTQALIVETGQTAVCNRHHSVDQQLCRWILASLDRSNSGEVSMTQELIANMLGVRRESVTEAAGKLQQAGLIRYSRGHIAVLDRPRLEAQACECYAVVKREYYRLLSK
jgi:CRP-like cAMP-binding protein